MTATFDHNRNEHAPIFFIVGRGRSGTALLTRILNEHPAFSVAPEGLFIRNLQKRYARIPAFSEKEARWFFREAFAERKMEYWQMQEGAFEDLFVERAKGGDLRNACLTLYRLYAEKVQGKERPEWIGDKNPHYSLYVPQLHELFPQACFLHLVRDPRDNVRSFRNVAFDIQNVAGLARRWKVFEERIEKARRAVPEDRYLQLHYEDLLKTPEDTLTRICTFFGCSFKPHMLDFHKHQEKEYRDWHKNLNSPLDPGKIGKWRNELTTDQVGAVERICGEKMEQYAYQKEASDRSLKLREKMGSAFGRWVTAGEEGVFRLPFWLRMFLINLYRWKAGAK